MTAALPCVQDLRFRLVFEHVDLLLDPCSIRKVRVNTIENIVLFAGLLKVQHCEIILQMETFIDCVEHHEHHQMIGRGWPWPTVGR